MKFLSRYTQFPVFALVGMLVFTGDGQALPKCPGSPLTGFISKVRTWNNCSGTHIFPQYTRNAGASCVCEWRNGKPHGQGILFYVNGDKYVGQFKDGKMHGEGAYMFANGDKHVGQFEDGKKHGKGAYTFASGRVERGVWKWGKFQTGSKNASASGSGSSAPPSGSFGIGSLSDNLVCHNAIQGIRPKWEIVSYAQEFIIEAKKRGYTENGCARLTGRFAALQTGSSRRTSYKDKKSAAKSNRTRRDLAQSTEAAIKRMDKARQKFSSLQSEVAALGAARKNIKKDIEGLKERIASIESKRPEAPATVDNIRRNVLELESVTTDMQRELKKLTTVVTKISSGNDVRTSNSPAQQDLYEQFGFAIWLALLVGIALLVMTGVFLVASIRNHKRTEALTFALEQRQRKISNKLHSENPKKKSA